MKQSNSKREVVQPTTLQQVRFNDGMIVTAEDLQDAASYPLDVFKTLIRAFFGCGIVCGLKVEAGPVDDKGVSWCVEVKPGVALDCHGHPIELCRTVKFNLDEAYPCDTLPRCVCLAIRRCTTEESPQPNPNCSGEKSRQEDDCTRVREQVIIKVFDPAEPSERPRNICMVDPGETGLSCDDGQADEIAAAKMLEQYCECIKACPDKACCGDAWILLACIDVDVCGVKCVDNKLRQYIKPIHYSCPPERKEVLERQCNHNVTPPPPDPDPDPDPEQSIASAKPPTKKTSTRGRTVKKAASPKK